MNTWEWLLTAFGIWAGLVALFIVAVCLLTHTDAHDRRLLPQDHAVRVCEGPVDGRERGWC